MHIRLGISKLKQRRDLHLCGLMYKRAKQNEYIDDRELQTRQFDKVVLKIPDVALTKSFSMPCYKGPTLWNILPRNVQLSPTYKEFKYRYKTMINIHLP